MINWDRRQEVEGFFKLLSQSGTEQGPGPGRGPDYRGPSGYGATREWWLPVASQEESDLVWLTADVPEAVDSTFIFIGESADLPENIYPSTQATLYANERAVVTFELGQRSRRIWVEADWALEFIPKQVNTTLGDRHRQFGPSSNSGIYRLAAPASALKAGRPLRLKIILESLRTDAINFFAVRQRSDAIEVNPRINADQIDQLQQELIRLKRVVGALSRRSYPELLEDRLPTTDVIIYTSGRDHVHSPDVLCLQNGEMLACWRDGSEHISNDGKIAMVRSIDGGRTWGDWEVVAEYPNTDYRELSLVQLRDGTLLGNRWHSTYYDPQGHYIGKVHDSMYPGHPAGIYVGRSADNGHTWEWPEKGIDPGSFEEIFSSERIVELESGRLLMPTYYAIGGPGDRHSVAVAYCSDDKGYTWRYLSIVADVAGLSLSEPVFLQTRSGRIISMARNDTGPEYYQSLSDDDGETWTPASPSTVPGHTTPCSLLQIPSGTVLCVYGSRLDPSGIYVVASHDEGETWDMANRRIIRDDFPNRDCGYTSTVLVPDGRIFSTYYYNMFHRFFIAGSFFKWNG